MGGMRPLVKPLALGMVLMLGACATSIPPVEVTRFHLDETIVPGTVAVDTAEAGVKSLEYATFANAVSSELQRIGFQPAAIGESQYVATIAIARDTREALAQRSPVSIGVGGGTGGYGSGVGLGLGFSLGGKPKDMVITELRVQIKRRAGATVIWEGRAETEAKANAPAAQPGIAAGKLASALFRDFPGKSGSTITVP